MTQIPARTSLPLILLLWAAGLGAAAQFAKIAVIYPTIQILYPTAGISLGFLVSLISFLGIAFGLTAGLVANRFGLRRLLLIGLALGALVSLYQSSFPSLELMLGARLLEGLSHLIIVVCAPTLIAQFCAPNHRPAAMTLWSTFFGVAFALVAWLGIPLVHSQGPAVLFQIHAGWMLIVAGLLAIALPKHRVISAIPSKISLLRQHLNIYRSPQMSAPAIGWLFYTLTFVSLLAVLPPFLNENNRAFAIGAMPLASLIVSLTFGMALLRFMSAISVVVLGFGLSAVLGLALWVDASNASLAIALFGALGLVQSASFAAIPQLNPTPTDQALANGAMAQMGNLGNTTGTPLLLLILTLTGQGGMLLFVIACYLCGIAAHVFLVKRRNQASSSTQIGT